MSAGLGVIAPLDPDRVASIAARLDLREPNREALLILASVAYQHFEEDREPPPFEGVIDVATGVGKTYILAAAIDYFAADGIRDFAVITPGRTILDKTVANFTPGHPKSLLAGMETRPVVITSENFATPAMRAAMDDPQQVKLYIFTVQSLIRPKSKAGRKAHAFQEGLGEAFYGHLQEIGALVVFADEHHAYYGKAFSEAVRGLRPLILAGLTATPHKQTPRDQIIYQYPLAAAIADRLVKTPVIVGRRDDLTDPRTKLRDGTRLLELKEQIIAEWCRAEGVAPVTPLMLVIAPSIAEAEEISAIVDDPTFAGGAYAGRVLTVHSDAADEALAQLDALEQPDNPWKIVVSVGMLKEGWDVKNVYVIASLRASVSDILTEQTLGRGLRLPFGRYTGVELLDTLEVLGHERYEELLRRSNVLNEQFIDLRTRAVLRRNAQGQAVVERITTPVQADLFPQPADSQHGDSPTPERTEPAIAGVQVQSVEQQTQRGTEDLAALQLQLPPRLEMPSLRIPTLRMTQVANTFSLSDIIDLAPFRTMGERFRADPAGALRRVRIRATIVKGQDGLRRTVVTTDDAEDRVASQAMLQPLDVLREDLLTRVLNASIVPARRTERYPAGRIVDELIAGLDSQAELILTAYMDRVAGDLIRVMNEEQRKLAAKPTYDQVVEMVPLVKQRTGRPETTADHYGAFRRGVGYLGYAKSLYGQDWFDSSTERDVANVLDSADDITCWVRLLIGDLQITWDEDRKYNPDFVAIDQTSTHWLIEVKMDREMQSAEVKGKRDAAIRWSNHVSAKVGVEWRYLLVSESDTLQAKGSWPALVAAGG